MANIKSSEKRAQIGERNRQRNKAKVSALKTAVKKAKAAIEAKTENVVDSVKAAVKLIDSVEQKGTIHRNKAARLKSRLAKRLNKISA